jgi:hypothetical protein
MDNFNDYIPWVNGKLSTEFHVDPNDPNESELRTAIEDFIAIADRLDKMKKKKFYGREVESGIEVRISDQPFSPSDDAEKLLHAVIGMATETSEMLEAICESKWEGKELDTVNFLEEQGDLEFYRSIVYDKFKWTESGVREVNVKKLDKRYEKKFTSEEANNRDLEAERKILEDGKNDIES